MPFNPEEIRSQFPALSQKVYGKPLVYFDNAATTLKPQCVINELKRYYEQENSNIHRGTHYLSQKATEAYEEARRYTAGFINAGHSEEIIFVRGTTEGINLVASVCARAFMKPGDEILISGMEHHSNIVPWQMVCEQCQTQLKVIPVLENGSLNLHEFEKLLSPATKLLAITHISNALGVINPVRDIIRIAHQKGVIVLVDGAQGIVHAPVDVRQMDCDFYCFSGHKIYGPMGTGVVYGKRSLLESLPPWQGGGEMISEVTFEKTTYNELPFKFEAGTPNVGGVLGLKAALQFVADTGIDLIRQQEDEVLEYATDKLMSLPGIQIYGTYPRKAGVISFLAEGIHPYDLGVILDKTGVAVRTGHHCAQPLMDAFGIPGTVRVSFAMYNTIQEVDVFIQSLEKAIQMLR